MCKVEGGIFVKSKFLYLNLWIESVSVVKKNIHKYIYIFGLSLLWKNN